MSSIIKTSIRKLIILVCYMWLWDTRENPNSDWIELFVYQQDIDFIDERLLGRRIKITFEIKDWRK